MTQEYFHPDHGRGGGNVKRQPVLEKYIVARIMATLKKYPNVIARKRHGTVMGTGGDPDIYGCIQRDGRALHFEIEVKRLGDTSSRLTKLQAQRLLEWKLAGSIVGVARSVDDALAILGLPPRNAQGEPVVVWVCSGCHEHKWESEDPPARCPRCGHLHFEKEAAA